MKAKPIRLKILNLDQLRYVAVIQYSTIAIVKATIYSLLWFSKKSIVLVKEPLTIWMQLFEMIHAAKHELWHMIHSQGDAENSKYYVFGVIEEEIEAQSD